MPAEPDLPTDPAALAAELKRRDAKITELTTKITELTTERDEAQERADRMLQHTEDHNALIERWIEIFALFDPEECSLWEAHSTVLEENRKLVAERNKAVARVTPRLRGRPRAASQSQEEKILRLRKAKKSLAVIAKATGVSLRTVRTVLSGQRQTNAKRRKEYDRHRAAAYRVRKKARDRLPQQITEQLKAGTALIKEAKGLGRSS